MMTENGTPWPVPKDQASQTRIHLRDHAMHRAFFDTDTIETMVEELKATDWISENVLAKGFEGTQGFSIQFTRSGLPKLRARLPAIGPYLDLVEGSRGLEALLSLRSRWFPIPTGTTERILFESSEVPVGDCVPPHVDGTLTEARVALVATDL